MVELDMTVGREPEQEDKSPECCAEKAAKCRTCYWATVHDGIIYCPSIKGTCLRREIIC